MEGSRRQLWALIEQITTQIYELQDQEGEANAELTDLADKLQRLLVLHKKYNEINAKNYYSCPWKNPCKPRKWVTDRHPWN